MSQHVLVKISNLHKIIFLYFLKTKFDKLKGLHCVAKYKKTYAYFFAERLSETCLDTHYVNCQLMFHSFSFSISVSSPEFGIILKLRNFVYQTARLNVRPFHFKNTNEIVIEKCPFKLKWNLLLISF